MSEIAKPTSTLDATSTTFAPPATDAPSSSEVKPSWADEVASPTAEKASPPLEEAQVDGSSEPLGGSGLHDAQYEVEVKLSDIQGDESSPLFSISSFEQLGM